MEDDMDGCPTEILIELKEDSYKPSVVNPKDFQNLHDHHKLDGCLKNGDHFPLMRQSEDCKSILDISPFRIEEVGSANSRTVFAAIQDLKVDLNSDDCPTGILVDLPHSSNSPSKAGNFFCNTPCPEAESKMTHLQMPIIKDADSEEVCLNSGIKNFRLADDADDDCLKSDEEKNKSSASKSSFKTPSPQTMSLIKSEVSKVISNLNSSVVFGEDDLLNEEMLPLPQNFDNYDLDDASDMDKRLLKQKEACKREIIDCKQSSVISVQTHDSSVKNDGSTVNNVIFHHDFNGNVKASLESKVSQCLLSAEVGCLPLYSYSTEKITSEKNVEENGPCDFKSDSLDISNVSASANSTDDVFIRNYTADEDKENVQRNNRVLPKKTPKSCTFLQKKSFISEKRGSRETLKNLSNINLKPKNKDSSLRTCQNLQNKPNTPQIKMSSNSKVSQPPSSKNLQLKKTVSAVESGIASKRMSLSNSFHFQSSKEFISSLQKPCFMDENTRFYHNNAYKSCMKQENQDKMKNCFTTPSKRYSISTPLKGTAPKPQFTPSLQGSQNCALPRFTPQAARGSCLSFSKSLQSSSKISNFSMKQQCSVSSVSSKLSQPSVARYNSFKPEKSVGQGTLLFDGKISEKKPLSTSSVKRFHSKLSLPSPLSAAQDKKLARALFPSMP